jgi:hypothetical protein
MSQGNWGGGGAPPGGGHGPPQGGGWGPPPGGGYGPPQGQPQGGAYGVPQAALPVPAAAGRRVELRITTVKKVAFVMCALLAPCSFGTTLLVVLWMLYISPTAVDEEGLTPRFGNKLLWRNLSDVTPIRIERYGKPVGFRIEFKFGSTGKGQIDSFTFENAVEAIQLVESVTRRKMLP